MLRAPFVLPVCLALRYLISASLTGASEERQEIEALYRKHSPEAIGEVEGLLAQHGEPELLQIVRKKFRDIARLEAYVSQLDKIELLTALTHDDKMSLARTLTTEDYGAEEAIVTEGESADCMYFLQSGTASAIKRGSASDPSELVLLKEYEPGGERSNGLVQPPRCRLTQTVAAARVLW